MIPFIAELTFRLEWPLWVVLGVAAMGLVGGFVSYRLSTRPMGRRTFWTLVSLRAAAVLAAIIILLRPTSTLDEVKAERAVVAVVLDDSGSMVVADEDKAERRIDRLKTMIEEHKDGLKKLSGKYDIQYYTVTDRLAPVEKLDFTAAGRFTDLGRGLRDLAAKTSGRPCAGVVVLSDGAQNVGALDAVRMGEDFKAARAPIYCVGVGSDQANEAVKDIVARTVEAPQKVFVGNTFAGRAALTLRGLRDKPVDLVVTFGDEVVEKATVTAADDVVNLQQPFKVTAKKDGVYKLSVRAEAQKGELSADNNEVSTFVRVWKGELRILMLEGRFRYEALFLGRTLGTLKDFELERKYLVGAGADPRGLPQTAGAWRQYTVVVLGDVHKDLFTKESMLALREAVAEGLGLVMTGGQSNFGRGFAGTPVGELAPVVFASAGEEQFEGAYGVAVDPRQSEHYILQIDEDRGAALERFKDMPALDGGVAVKSVKPLAKVLLVQSQPPARPIVIVSDYGKEGRVAGVLADTTWKWAFQPESRYKETYERFWKQMVLWLAHRDKLDKDQAWLVLDKARYHLGTERVKLSAFAETAKGAPVEDADIQIQIRKIDAADPEGAGKNPPASSADFKLPHTASGYVGAWDAPATGDYEITMTASVKGEQIARQVEKFQVYLANIELDEPQANSRLLEQLAEHSGGRFVRPDKFGEVLDTLQKSDANIIIHNPVPQDLWDNFWMLAIFLGLVGTEWALRKKKGMA